MDWDSNLIYELMEHLDLATIRKLCSSDLKLRTLCQEQRFQNIVQRKLVDQLFNRIDYGIGLEYIINPMSGHSISISFDKILERNIGYSDKDQRLKNSILLNTIRSEDLGYDLQYIIVALEDPTDEQIKEVLYTIISSPGFKRRRINQWVD